MLSRPPFLQYSNRGELACMDQVAIVLQEATRLNRTTPVVCSTDLFVTKFVTLDVEVTLASLALHRMDACSVDWR